MTQEHTPQQKLEAAKEQLFLDWKVELIGRLVLEIPGCYLFRYVIRNDSSSGDIWRAEAHIGLNRRYRDALDREHEDWVELVIANDLLSPQLAEEAVVRHIQHQSSVLEEWLRTKGQGRPREEA
jgi:hypothetical protein